MVAIHTVFPPKHRFTYSYFLCLYKFRVNMPLSMFLEIIIEMEMTLRQK